MSHPDTVESPEDGRRPPHRLVEPQPSTEDLESPVRIPRRREGGTPGRRSRTGRGLTSCAYRSSPGPPPPQSWEQGSLVGRLDKVSLSPLSNVRVKERDGPG